MRTLSGFAAAVHVTYVIGALTISQVNLASVIALGMEINFSHRIDAMLHDVTHMYDIYLPLVIVALVIAFSVAALITRQVPSLRMVGYMLAGFVGLIAIHVIMTAVLGMTGVAATRSMVGLLLQGVAGAAGGYLFHLLTAEKLPLKSGPATEEAA